MSPDDTRTGELPWTGERYLPEIAGEIELEHLHRYAIARDLAYGKDVLDIACGEGYGSELLATVARKVTGVDISEETIAHATRKYVGPNIAFAVGSCACIPLADASIDLVVSFETIEHHDRHLEMMQEIRRVLRPAGVLIISSPDKHEYSDVPDYKNEYHVKELYLSEFRDLLATGFRRVRVFGQRVYFGSLVAPTDGHATRFANYSKRGQSVRREPGVMRPVYYIALASNAALPQVHGGLYDGTSYLSSQLAGRDGQIASLTQAVAERDGRIASLNQAAAERDGRIASLNEAVAERDRQMDRRNQTVAERDGRIASLNQAVAERDAQIAKLRHEIASLNQALAKRDAQMVTLNQARAKRDRQLATLNKAVTERDRLRRKLQALRISTSWRLTAPLRLIKRSSLQARRRLRKAAAIIARSVYRLLPLSARQKVLLKGWFFSSSPSRALAVGANTSVKQSSVGDDAVPSGVTRPVSQGPVVSANTSVKRSSVGDDAVPSGMTRPVSQGPVVSVVIPVYDRTDDLRACIRSILTQTFEDFEIILVTDGSPRETLHVLDEFANHPKVRVFMYPDNTGTAVRGRNRGIRAARGRYVAFQDSDDVAEPQRLEWSVQALEESGAAVVYGGWRARLDGTRLVEGLQDGQEVYSPDCDLDSLLQACVPCQSTVMAARAALLDAGGLKPSMRYREDHELWCRLAFFGYRFKAVNKILTNLNLHQGNNELNFQKDGDKWYEMLLHEYRQKNFLPLNIAFAIPGAGICGGIYVVFEHAVRLKNRGHRVTILSRDPIAKEKLFWHPQALDLTWMTYGETQWRKFDVCFATWWETAYELESIPAHHYAYFNQSVESRFYPESATEIRRMAEDTYKLPYSIVTEAMWIRDYIREKYRKEAHVVRNGIRKELYTPDGQCFAPREPGRLRVLVEGPLQVPFKNVARTIELCQGVADEVWLLTSTDTKEVKGVDRLFSHIPITVVPDVYRSCDVLVKLSYVEGMFGPPLEMFHCGGTAIVYDVSGHDEYIRDRHNALVAHRDDEETVRSYLKQLKTDADLLSSLKEGAAETARQWPDWEVSSKEFEETIRDIIHEQAKKWISNSTRSNNADVVVPMSRASGSQSPMPEEGAGARVTTIT